MMCEACQAYFDLGAEILCLPVSMISFFFSCILGLCHYVLLSLSSRLYFPPLSLQLLPHSCQYLSLVLSLPHLSILSLSSVLLTQVFYHEGQCFYLDALIHIDVIISLSLFYLMFAHRTSFFSISLFSQ